MPTRLLRPRDIEFIENALRKIGAFGEVHLVVERGRIRYVRTIKSESIDEPKIQPSVVES
ncbi:MAG: hypothetical protein HY868_09780 [Chloroflexi bacterium]|nr:hypothetical protein [Chloroflexota bacterium]